MPEKHLLDLPGIDVVAPAQDEVLFAVQDEVVAVRIAHGHVPGGEPAVAQDPGRVVRTVPVPGP
jgi:hypothetical protein